MKTGYCQSCEQTTGFKRSIGVGTLLGAACTGGVSLVATPFYPLRCVRCGSTKEPVVHHVLPYEGRGGGGKETYDIWGIFILIIVCLFSALLASIQLN